MKWFTLCLHYVAKVIGYGSRRSKNGKQELKTSDSREEEDELWNLGRKRMGRRVIDSCHEAILMRLDHFCGIYGALSAGRRASPVGRPPFVSLQGKQTARK